MKVRGIELAVLFALFVLVEFIIPKLGFMQILS